MRFGALCHDTPRSSLRAQWSVQLDADDGRNGGFLTEDPAYHRALRGSTHLQEQLEGEGLGGDLEGVVAEQAASHEPHRVQLVVLLLYALLSARPVTCAAGTSGAVSWCVHTSASRTSDIAAARRMSLACYTVAVATRQLCQGGALQHEPAGLPGQGCQQAGALPAQGPRAGETWLPAAPAPSACPGPG